MVDVKSILQEFTDRFQSKLDPEHSYIIQFNIAPSGQVWHLMVSPGRQVALEQGPHPDARFIVLTSDEILEKIYQGKINAMTAGGRAKMSDPAPLDFKMGEGVRLSPDVYSELLSFAQRFFNRFDPERVVFGEEHSRVVHGGHVVALFYHPGFRSAWYMIRKGEQINEDGDTNPFPQTFIFITGEGYAKIGQNIVPVKAGESYYVPPNEKHIIWTESDRPLEMIWLAFGEGA